MQYIWIVINSCLSYLVVKTFGASVHSVNVTSGARLQGQSLVITCQLTDVDNLPVYIYKSPSETVDDASYLAFCRTICISTDPAYVVEMPNGALTVTIKKLNRTDDERWWTCSVSESSKTFYLTVFTEPRGVSLESVDCDLAVSACTFTCKTSCTYPKPKFTWSYSDGSSDDGLFARVDKSESNKTNGCTDWEGHASETISIPQYTTFFDNSDHTRNLKCRIKHHLSDKYVETNASRDLRFAVNVKNVSLHDGSKILNGNDKLFVLENANISLKCISSPMQARPHPTIKLRIPNDTVISASGTVVSFQVKEAYHGANVYCESINTLKPVYSEAVQLFVQVTIKTVVIRPANTSIIKAILEHIEPTTCVASGGRPGSTLKWYKKGKKGNFQHITENINVTYSNHSNFFVTTESIYRLKASMSDDGLEYYCSGQNLRAMTPLKSDLKTLEVQYPPIDMTITDKNNNTVRTTMDSIRGKNVQLLCSARSNPSVDQFLWNVDGQRSRTLIINNIQSSVTANCTARNFMSSTSGITAPGVNWHAIRINVLYGANITSLMLNVNGITKESKTVIVGQNSSISIACNVDSNPGSTIKLLKASEVLEERSDSLELIYNIASAACSDNSDYTCQASNGVEQGTQPDKRKVQLYVTCSPRAAAGTVSSVFARQNESAVLSVMLLAYPIPYKYTWYKNGSNGWEDVANFSSMHLTNATLQFNLTIKTVVPHDFGGYRLTVENGIGDPYSYIIHLKRAGDEDLFSDTPDNGSVAAVIGGVVGGLLVAGMIIVVLCFLRRRNGFDGIKVFLFGPKSTASRPDTDEIGQGYQDEGYSYALVDEPKRQKEMNLIHNLNVPAAATKQDEDSSYENPMMSDDSNMKDKLPKTAKTTKPKSKKQPTQSHDGLVYIDVHFEDKKANANQKKNQKAAAKPKASEGVVYDAVQFGVVGEPFSEEKNQNNKMQ